MPCRPVLFKTTQIIDTKINTLRIYYNIAITALQIMLQRRSMICICYGSFHLHNYTFLGVLLMSLMDDVKEYFVIP